MSKKIIVIKLIPFIIALEIVIFSDSYQLLGLGIIAGALLMEILNFSMGRLNSSGNLKNKSKNLQEIKVSKDNITYNEEIISFIEDLKTQFTNLTDSNYYRESSRLALNQLIRVVDKFEKFKNILDVKLDQDEITYERFMSVTEEVYYNILDNLEKVKDIFKSIEDIDVKYIETRIDTLNQKTELSDEMAGELNSLGERKEMLLKELNSANKYISINEKAITDIDDMKIKLGRLKTASKQANLEFDQSISDLRRMARRVNEYFAEK